MNDLHVDRLPVVDNNGRYVGFLSHFDVMKRFYSGRITEKKGARTGGSTRAFEGERPDVRLLPVSDFMSKKAAVTISEDDTISMAAKKMSSSRVLSLLIMEGDKPLSILT